MKHFTSFYDVPDHQGLLDLALKLKANPHGFTSVGQHKTIGLVFMNPSLRTRLSSIKAAYNLGADVWVLNAGADSWVLETGDGTIMDGSSQEHIKEAMRVMSTYCDVIGVRTFPGLVDREKDYTEAIMNQIKSLVTVPLVSLESATLHPLQSLADYITLKEHNPSQKKIKVVLSLSIKVVLSWVPHVKALPQAVANSFAQWMSNIDWVDLHIAHPQGYQLEDQFIKNTQVHFDQQEAFEGADFIYAKNWSSYCDYGQIIKKDFDWMINQEKMNWTNNAKFMHCLPVRRNVVVADEILDSDQSVVIQQSENRIYAAQAVFYELLRG
ncbi:unnamed protein product, partial [Cyprideis torosa]